MRRLVFGLALLVLPLAGVPAAQAAPLDDARRRERALEAELRAATTELQAAAMYHLAGGPVNPYPYLKRACG